MMRSASICIALIVGCKDSRERKWVESAVLLRPVQILSEFSDAGARLMRGRFGSRVPDLEYLHAEVSEIAEIKAVAGIDE